jgi:multiple sugar transport system substrate-binding protein
MIKISRRDFLRKSALLAGTAVITACTPAPTPTSVPTQQPGKALEKKPATFSGAKISGVMRNNFVPAMNTLQANQAKQWGDMVGASVELSFSNDYREKAAAAVESGAGGDIFELFQNNALVYAEKLVDLSDICNDLEKKFGGWYDVAKQAGFVNGVWRAVPRSYTAHAVNYRPDYFEKAGITKIPETWNDLLEAGKKLKAAKQPLLGFPVAQTAPNDSANFLYSLLWSYGGKEVESDGKTVAIKSAETKAAIEYIKALAEVSAPDITAYDDSSNNRNFLAGTIAATNNAVSIYVTAQTQYPDIAKVMDHFMYPSGPAGRKQFVEMNLLCILNTSKNIDATKAFLQYLLEEAQINPFFQLGQSFASPMLNNFENVASMPWNLDPKLKLMKGVGKSGLLPGWPGPASRKSGEVFNKQVIVNMFGRVLAGESIDKSIETTEKELKAIYNG